MSRKVRPLEENDLPAVAALLKRAFAGSSAPIADAGTLRWKYLQTGPIWDGSRAYVVEQDGEIVAHSGFVPATFLPPDKAPITSLVATDWAADPKSPGVGVMVYARVIRLAETAFLVGGVDVTREIVPKLGFKPFAEFKVYARWIRPVREFWQRDKSVRALQRLGHGLYHTIFGASLKGGSWMATPVDSFQATIEPVLDFRPRRRTTCLRTLASLNHTLACPIVRMKGYLLRDGRQVRGYAIVAYLGWEARLVDINIDSENSDDWTAAYGAAVAAATRDPHVCRIRAMAAVPDQQQSLERNGFWVNSDEPVVLFDPKSRAPELPIDLQFIESDLSYV